LDLVDEVSGGDGPSEPLARQIGLGLGNLYVYELLALLAEVQRELQQIVERLAGDISYKVYERARSMQIQLNDETPVAKIRQALEKNSSSGSDRRGLQLLGAALKILSVAVEAPK
jgi:hypothetical protein